MYGNHSSGPSYGLFVDDARGVLLIRDVGFDGARLLDSFDSYEDACDVMSDLRAMCVGGARIADVVAETYGKVG